MSNASAPFSPPRPKGRRRGDDYGTTSPTAQAVDRADMKTLFDAKPGDILIVVNARGRRVVKVEHETKTQIKTKNGTRWNKNTGCQVGRSRLGEWHFERIRMPVEGEVEEIQLICKYMRALDELEDYIRQVLRKAKPGSKLLEELIQVKARLNVFLQPNASAVVTSLDGGRIHPELEARQ